MKTIIDGACKFCGQIRQVEVESNSSDAVIIETATKRCGCSEAIEYRMITNGIQKIKELFNDDYPEAADILCASTKAVVQGRIAKVTVDTGWNVKGTITLKKDKLNVKKETKLESESNIK